MLQIRNLTYSIGTRVLLHEIDWNIPQSARVALIGTNGAGKTTLLKLMAGILPIQEGEILKPNRYQIGYLPQEEMEWNPVWYWNWFYRGIGRFWSWSRKSTIFSNGFPGTESATGSY